MDLGNIIRKREHQPRKEETPTFPASSSLPEKVPFLLYKKKKKRKEKIVESWKETKEI
jgi:hypothetical protein